jgi:hypothetical protein
MIITDRGCYGRESTTVGGKNPVFDMLTFLELRFDWRRSTGRGPRPVFRKRVQTGSVSEKSLFARTNRNMQPKIHRSATTYSVQKSISDTLRE